MLLDEDWQPIGQAPKLASHHNNTPLHLAFSCYVFNRHGQVLVTRRALSKKTWPGVWTNSCCGHPAPGEAIEAAITRRLKDELSIVVSDLQLRLPTFRYRAEFRGIVENECCPVYTAVTATDPVLNPDEVMDYHWMSWPELTAAVSTHPADYSDWCRLQIPLLQDFVAA